MIYTDFMNTKNVEQGSAVTPSGHPGADYYQKCHFFVLLDSNVLVDCIEFLILCRHCNLALSISEKNGRNRSHLARVPGKTFPGYLCDFSHRF